MILPAVIAVLSPLLAGLVLGVNGVTGLLLGSSVTGFLLAVFMSNSGGAWTTPKIRRGRALRRQGKLRPQGHRHRDTVGDPFKDTSGPSINILIKLISVVAIVFAQVILTIGLL